MLVRISGPPLKSSSPLPRTPKPTVPPEEEVPSSFLATVSGVETSSPVDVIPLWLPGVIGFTGTSTCCSCFFRTHECLLSGSAIPPSPRLNDEALFRFAGLISQDRPLVGIFRFSGSKDNFFTFPRLCHRTLVRSFFPSSCFWTPNPRLAHPGPNAAGDRSAQSFQSIGSTRGRS